MSPDRSSNALVQRKRHILFLTAAFTATLIVAFLLRLGPGQMTFLPESLVPSLTSGKHSKPKHPESHEDDEKHAGSFKKPALTATLPAQNLPNATKKLIIIGDVHGQIDSLRALLEKVEYSTDRGDHVIFAGDMITKGIDSPAVVRLAMEMGASAVRGNHEDKVLRAWDEYLRTGGEHGQQQVSHGRVAGDDNSKASRPLAVARSLSESQLQWLAAKPAILDLGIIPDHGRYVVVHGGLVPNLALQAQDSQAVMNVRTLLYPSDSEDHDSVSVVAKPLDGREGRPWSEAWDTAQEALAKSGGQGMSVVYGHDARTGLKVRKWTYGLDSACVKGGQLTALVFEPASAGDKQEIVRKIVSVECEDPVVESKEKEKAKKDKADKKKHSE
jgi:hypothetical protein